MVLEQYELKKKEEMMLEQQEVKMKQWLFWLSDSRSLQNID